MRPGREYAAHEWVEFLYGEKDRGTEAEQAVTSVIKESMEYLIDSCWRAFQVEQWGKQRHLDRHDDIDWHYLTYLAHCSLAARGVDFWDSEDKFEQWLGRENCGSGDRDTQPGFLFERFINHSEAPCAVAFRVFSQDLDSCYATLGSVALQHATGAHTCV